MTKTNKTNKEKIEKIIRKYLKRDDAAYRLGARLVSKKSDMYYYQYIKYRKNFIDELCQLIPEEGEIIAEGKVNIIDEDEGFSLYIEKEDGEMVDILDEVEKYADKKIQLIIKEIK